MKSLKLNDSVIAERLLRENEILSEKIMTALGCCREDAAIDGHQVGETRGFYPGGGRRDVHTIPGQRYLLSFWYANHPLALSPPATEVELWDLETSQILEQHSFSPELTSTLTDHGIDTERDVRHRRDYKPRRGSG